MKNITEDLLSPLAMYGLSITPSFIPTGVSLIVYGNIERHVLGATRHIKRDLKDAIQEDIERSS